MPDASVQMQITKLSGQIQTVSKVVKQDYYALFTAETIASQGIS